MKNFFLLVLTLGIFSMSTPSMALSFPVERTVTTTVNENNEEVTTVATTSPAAAVVLDRQITAILLLLFTGFVAGHRWYLGSPVGWNILYIITLGGLGIWALIDLIDLITENYPGL